MNKKPKLTQALIDREGALPCPEGFTHYEYPAGDRSGLYLDVRPNSEIKSWYGRWKNQDGKSVSTFLGRANLVPLREAKQKFLVLKGELAKGRDLQAEARAKKQVISWNEFFEGHYLPHAKQHKRSWKNDEEMHRLRIKDRFGHLRLNKITRSAVQQFHSELKDSGLSGATCDHYAKLIRQALNLACTMDLLGVNPVAKVTLFHEPNQVDNIMSREELARFLKVLKEDHNRTVCLVILFLLSTGARVSEALGAQWKDINRKTRTWRIPATNSKSKKIRAVPLNDTALQVLDQLGTEGRYDHLFISNRRKAPLTTISKQFKRICLIAGLPQLRVHDVRHQFASLLVCSGQDIYRVKEILGHSSVTVTERYSHLSTQALQEATSAASDQIAAAMKEETA